MPDREKVIKGLECCAVKNITPESARHCGICPYDRERNGEMDFDCQNDLLCAALELLKEQESRVMTLEELFALPKDTPVFIEEDNGDCGWNVLCEIDEEYDVCFCGFQARPVFYPSKSYGKVWRCWTSRPTEEEREKVKWYGE